MKNYITPLFIAVFLIHAPQVNAQNGTPTDPAAGQPDQDGVADDPSDWEYSLRTSVTGSQAKYQNWSQGGVDNVAIMGGAGFSAKYSKDIFIYNLGINLGYGQTRVGSGDFIKSDDQIRIRNQVRRLFRDERFSAIFNLNFDSQFDYGYDRDDPDLVISKFFAPAYLSQVLGFSYNPDPYFRAESGLAMKQTFVRDTALSTRYGLAEGDTFRNEAGFSVLVGYERRIMESIFYSGYVETFTNVNKSLSSTDVYFTNEITGQINRFFSAKIEFALAYNDDVIDEWQVKQILSVGFNYSFFEE